MESKKIPLSKVYADMTLTELKQQIDVLEFMIDRCVGTYENRRKCKKLIDTAFDEMLKKQESMLSQIDFPVSCDYF